MKRALQNPTQTETVQNRLFTDSTRAEAIHPPVSRCRRLKVLHIVNRMAVGGTENVVLNIAGKLTDGFEHHVCCIRNYDAELIKNRFNLNQIQALELPHARLSFFVPRLYDAIRACGPDIVHSRNWGAIESVFAARLARVPVVIHSEHGYEVDVISKTPLRQRLTRRAACALADAFFTVSRDLREFHAEQAGVPVERIRVLHNGVDTDRFAPNPDLRVKVRSEYGIKADDFVVGAVGRAVAIKDYKTLIRALGALANDHLQFKLVLVGDGPELPGLLALAESIPGVRASFLAVGQRSDVSELLAGMDAFVQTSLREGMSNTLLEAMSSGLPAVVTDVGGNPEIVDEGRTGWLFKPGDAGQLSRLLLRLAGDRKLRLSAGQAARLRVQSMFSQEKMLESYRELYSGLARRRNVLAAGWKQGLVMNGERA